MVRAARRKLDRQRVAFQKYAKPLDLLRDVLAEREVSNGRARPLDEHPGRWKS